MKLNYSSKVKASVERMVKVARPMLLQRGPQEEVEFKSSALLVLAGLGGARLKDDKRGAPLWVSTRNLRNVLSCALKELDQLQNRVHRDGRLPTELPFNAIVKPILRSLDEPGQCGFESTRTMRIVEFGLAPSLKLAIAIMVERNKENCSDEEAGEVTPDLALLTLAGRGHAELDLVEGIPVWVPGIDLLLNFKWFTAGGHPTQKAGSNRRTGKSETLTKVRMDALLTDLTDYCYRSARRQLPDRDPGRDVASLFVLMGSELYGDAIPYKDADGCLAWKASDQFRREYKPYGDDGDNDDGHPEAVPKKNRVSLRVIAGGRE